MSTHLKETQTRFAEAIQKGEALNAERRRLQQSIATAQARLADLEIGKGAPDKVSEWLKLKSSIVTQIAEATAALEVNQETISSHGQAQARLYEAAKSAVRSELANRRASAATAMNEHLAQAARYAIECAGHDTYGRQLASAPGISDAESTSLHRFYNAIPVLPGAVRELYLAGFITDALVGASAREWRALADDLAHLKPEEETSTAQAAE